jgi:hypothetical protein
MDDYNASEITRVPWPRWTANRDGRWERAWRFEFEHPSTDTGLPSVVGPMSVESHWGQDGVLDLITTVSDKPWSDQVFFEASFELFRLLEQRFGKLKRINTLDRGKWLPFRLEEGERSGE